MDARRYDIDLRSDTVTRPPPGMRAAMAAAEVGDDVYGDDPTVNRLQALMAERFGFESALFFASGTQSNLAALMAHCGARRRISGGSGGAHLQLTRAAEPRFWAASSRSLWRMSRTAAFRWSASPRPSSPRTFILRATRLLALENTIGGRVLPPAYQRQVTRFAHERGLITHLDGARIFNAIVKLEDRRAYGASRASTPCRYACRRGWAHRRVRCCGQPRGH